VHRLQVSALEDTCGLKGIACVAGRPTIEVVLMWVAARTVLLVGAALARGCSFYLQRRCTPASWSVRRLPVSTFVGPVAEPFLLGTYASRAMPEFE
jgi:hypothetical protein